MELDAKNASATASTREMDKPDSTDSNQPSDSNDDDDDTNHADEEPQDVAPPVFGRSPPPELEGFPDIPDLNVLGIGGMQNVNIVRGHGHAWGGGVRLGAAEHNPHATEPVLQAQTPGESAVRRLEMRQQQQQQQQLHSGAGQWSI